MVIEHLHSSAEVDRTLKISLENVQQGKGNYVFAEFAALIECDDRLYVYRN